MHRTSFIICYNLNTTQVFPKRSLVRFLKAESNFNKYGSYVASCLLTSADSLEKSLSNTPSKRLSYIGRVKSKQLKLVIMFFLHFRVGWVGRVILYCYNIKYFFLWWIKIIQIFFEKKTNAKNTQKTQPHLKTHTPSLISHKPRASALNLAIQLLLPV